MFLFHPIHFLKFLVKSQPQRSYNKGSYIYKPRVYVLYFGFKLFHVANNEGHACAVGRDTSKKTCKKLLDTIREA